MDPRYPIGRFQFPERPTPEIRAGWIDDIRGGPALLRDAVRGLSDEQLDTPYREGGWTPRQIVHHVADSHMHSYIRFKWTLTEDTPTIKAYSQNGWAETPDARGPVDASLDLLEGLHRRWADLLERLDEADWQRAFVHPETGNRITLERNLALYAWHGEHHAEQIQRLRKGRAW